MSTDLDLDALEREYEQQKTWGDEFQHLTDWKVVLPLIQRLREVEAALEIQRATTRGFHDRLLKVRKLAAIRSFNAGDLEAALERIEDACNGVASGGYIAQLERVREAARELRVAQKTGEDEIVSHGPKGSSTWLESLEARLDAALAAGEETNA